MTLSSQLAGLTLHHLFPLGIPVQVLAVSGGGLVIHAGGHVPQPLLVNILLALDLQEG